MAFKLLSASRMVAMAVFCCFMMNKDSTVEAQLNSGTVPQSFMDFLQQQGPVAPQPTASGTATGTASGTGTSGQTSTSAQAPSTQQLQQYQEVLKQQQQQLEMLQQRVRDQKLQQEAEKALQQQQAQQTQPQPAPTQTAQPAAQQPLSYVELREQIRKQIQTREQQAFSAHKPGFSHPPEAYQFKPLPAPTPAPTPAATIVTTREGLIDFVPAEHKPKVPYSAWPGQHSQHHQQTRPQQPQNQANAFAPWAQAMHKMTRASHMRPPPGASSYGSASRGGSVRGRQPRKPSSPFSNMPLPREFQMNAIKMGRQMCITQFYESHGCVDPVTVLPPGTRSNGLMLGCTNPASVQLCHVAGMRIPGTGASGRGAGTSNMAMQMMMRMSTSNALLERCLTQKTITKALTKMMGGGGMGGGGATNPAAMMMLMGGGGGGEGGGGMATLAMMNMLKGAGGGGGRAQTKMDLPAGAAAPGSNPWQNRGGGGMMGGGDPCMAVLPLIMAQGGEGGIFSPEGAATVRNMRKKMLPYTCQDIQYGVFFRMCCPGKVPAPSMMDMMSSCGGGA